MSAAARTNLSFHAILLEKMASSSVDNSPAESVKARSQSTPVTEFLEFQLRFQFQGRFGVSSGQGPAQRGKSSFPYVNQSQSSPVKAPPTVTPPVKVRPPEKSVGLAHLSLSARLAVGQLGLKAQSAVCASEVKRAFRRLARQHHPDLGPQGNAKLFCEYKELADLIIKEIEAA